MRCSSFLVDLFLDGLSRLILFLQLTNLKTWGCCGGRALLRSFFTLISRIRPEDFGPSFTNLPQDIAWLYLPTRPLSWISLFELFEVGFVYLPRTGNVVQCRSESTSIKNNKHLEYSGSLSDLLRDSSSRDQRSEACRWIWKLWNGLVFKELSNTKEYTEPQEPA